MPGSEYLLDTDYQKRLQDLPPFIYGTTRQGDNSISKHQRMDTALLAMQQVPWFHVSDQYGSALSLIGEAFQSMPERKPQTIFKMEVKHIEDYRPLIRRHCNALDVSHMDIGQLCLQHRQAKEFTKDNELYQLLTELKEQGAVHRYVMEVFPWTATIAEQALECGVLDHLVEGFIFYFNPLQRFTSNSLWKQITARNIPVIAMRSVCGNHVHTLRDKPGAAWQPYIQQRATQVAPIFDASGENDWGRFCLRFAHSFPFVRATVGSTATENNLYKFIDNSENLQPLNAPTLKALMNLQHQWAEEVDANAAAWSM